jgi:hypothetical protein
MPVPCDKPQHPDAATVPSLGRWPHANPADNSQRLAHVGTRQFCACRLHSRARGQCHGPGEPCLRAADSTCVAAGHASPTSPTVARVLTNLLGNALLATPAGGKVTVTARDVHGSWGEVVVTESGVGLSGEDIEQVFERFYRVPGQLRRFCGSGIGLTIARGIARAHGGDVTASSAGRGQGASFSAELPLRSADQGCGYHGNTVVLSRWQMTNAQPAFLPLWSRSQIGPHSGSGSRMRRWACLGGGLHVRESSVIGPRTSGTWSLSAGVIVSAGRGRDRALAMRSAGVSRASDATSTVPSS